MTQQRPASRGPRGLPCHSASSSEDPKAYRHSFNKGEAPPGADIFVPLGLPFAGFCVPLLALRHPLLASRGLCCPVSAYVFKGWARSKRIAAARRGRTHRSALLLHFAATTSLLRSSSPGWALGLPFRPGRHHHLTLPPGLLWRLTACHASGGFNPHPFPAASCRRHRAQHPPPPATMNKALVLLSWAIALAGGLIIMGAFASLTQREWPGPALVPTFSASS